MRTGQGETERTPLTGDSKAHTIDCILPPSTFTRSRKFECWEQHFLLKAVCKTKDELHVYPPNYHDTCAIQGNHYSSYQFPANKICGLAYCVRFFNNIGSSMEQSDAKLCQPCVAIFRPATQCVDGTLGRGVEYCLDIVNLLFCLHCCGKGLGKELRTDKPTDQATENDYQVRSGCAAACRGNVVDTASAALCGIPICLFTVLCSPCIACGEFNDKQIPEQFMKKGEDRSSGPAGQSMK